MHGQRSRAPAWIVRFFLIYSIQISLELHLCTNFRGIGTCSYCVVYLNRYFFHIWSTIGKRGGRSACRECRHDRSWMYNVIKGAWHMSKLHEIEGIGETYAKKLQDQGVVSIEQLLEKGGTQKGRKELEEASGIAGKLILGWVNRADLARIKGIRTQYADLLEVAGVDTVPELAQRSPENLHAKMCEVNEAQNLVRKLPALSQVQDWVVQARELPRMVSY